MAKLLKQVLAGSGLQEKLDATNRVLNQYSARHHAATQALMRGVNIYDLAINLGTSVLYIERTYSHITAMMKSKELTAGQGRWNAIEETKPKFRECYAHANFDVHHNGFSIRL